MMCIYLSSHSPACGTGNDEIIEWKLYHREIIIRKSDYPLKFDQKLDHRAEVDRAMTLYSPAPTPVYIEVSTSHDRFDIVYIPTSIAKTLIKMY